MDAASDERARLRAIESLLDYVIAEVQEFEVPELEQLLGAAALVVSEMIEKGVPRQRRQRPQKPALRVVVRDEPGK